MNSYYVYIMTNYSSTTLYVGVTNSVERRAFEHRQKFVEGFAEKYNIYKVVYAEEFSNSIDAIAREKQIKRWSRKKKENLINAVNPTWCDLLRCQ